MRNNKGNPVIVVQGGQWGSEAKGAVAAHLCLTRKVDYAVRTGAINAGHTVVYNGKPYAMQQIPTGWVNPNTQLVIGAGAYIHPPTLFREIEMINTAMPDSDVRDRLHIDWRCGIHDEAAENASKSANRHHSIGATGKGCSEAIVNKIRNRNNGAILFKEWWDKSNWNDGNRDPIAQSFGDTMLLLNSVISHGETVLIEGTQGTHLDLHLGPYPFTTSRMTSAANWIAEAGLSPSLEYEVVLVCRTLPIRVAGNSGPMRGEIEWTDIAVGINNMLEHSGRPPLVGWWALEEFRNAMSQAAHTADYPVPAVDTLMLSKWTPDMRSQFRVAASELHRDALDLCSPQAVAELRRLFEMTTVTKKLRRIAKIDFHDLRYAIAVNNPAWIALTFMDYIEPTLAGLSTDTVCDVPRLHTEAFLRASGYIMSVERELGVPVKLITTGPNPNNALSFSSGGDSSANIWAGIS